MSSSSATQSESHEAAVLTQVAKTLSPDEAARLETLGAELAKRRMEAVKIYESMPGQEEFHRSLATERVVRGGVRSGKSVCCYAEDARAAMGCDPHGKYPTNRPLTIWLIVYEEQYIGKTTYRLLFRAGAFDMIKDRQTGQWRAYRPWDPDDAARFKEKKPAPPLIPPRFVKEVSWKDRKDRIFKSVTLEFGPNHPMNGAQIRFFTSGAEPPQGDPVDLVHIDEDLKYPRHVPELQSRLSDRKGRLIWSVFPHSRNDALTDMSERAERDKELVASGELNLPDVEEFRLTFSGNPFIDADEKRKRIKGWSPEERRARDLGEFLFDRILVYPTFHRETHGTPKIIGDATVREGYFQEVDWLLRRRQVPTDWTRYMVVDPGHTLGATLFAAIPPSNVGDFVVCYDELYISNCEPHKWITLVTPKLAGHSFRAFIMDEHGGRQRSAVSAQTTRQHYTNKLREANIFSETTGATFLPGSDDVPGRIASVRDWLTIRPDGTTKLLVIVETCPNLVSEFGLYKKKRLVGGEILDLPSKGHDHLMDALGYLAAYNPQYVKPTVPEKPLSPAAALFQQWLKDSRKRRGEPAIFLGPGRN